MAKKEAKAIKENKNKKSFFKGFKAELKKVIWPTPKQLVNNTVAVIVIVLITALIVFVLDLAFESINKHGIDKVKEVITSSNSTSDENIETEDDNNDVEVTENTENSETQNNEDEQTTTEENEQQENVEVEENSSNAENNAQ